MQKWVLSIGLIIVVLSCNKSQNNIDLGHSYFPLYPELTRTYQVTEIFHDEALSPAHDTLVYQIKEVVGQPYTDDLGEQAFELFRYRKVVNGDWEIKDVWSTKRTPQRGEVVEENRLIVKLGFGINNTTVWDANAFNGLDETESHYRTINQPFSINGFNFDSTCQVVHNELTSFVDHQVSYDIYAKHIGNIYSVHKDLIIDNFDTLDVKKGQELILELIDYSN